MFPYLHTLNYSNQCCIIIIIILLLVILKEIALSQVAFI